MGGGGGNLGMGCVEEVVDDGLVGTRPGLVALHPGALTLAAVRHDRLRTLQHLARNRPAGAGRLARQQLIHLCRSTPMCSSSVKSP